MTVDYVPIANQAGANVEDQNQWLVDTNPGGSLSAGFVQGTAQSQQVNKALRQSSMIAAAVATYIANTLTQDVLDDGVLATLTTKLTNAINASALAQAQFVASTIAGPAMTVRGVTGQNAVAAPNTSFTLSSALQLVLRNASGNTVALFRPGALTVDLNLQGPVANGRDQISIFPISTAVHLYYIWGSTPGLATIVSLFSPNDVNATGVWGTGPTLPATFTHAAYVASLVLDAGAHLRPTLINGGRVDYRDSQVLFSGATPASLTPVSVDPAVPRIATRISYGAKITGSAGQSGVLMDTFLSPVNAGVGQLIAHVDESLGQGGPAPFAAYGHLELNYPQAGNVYHYTSNSGFASPTIILVCNGYAVPNGG